LGFGGTENEQACQLSVLNWGILGTGAIARHFAKSLEKSEHGVLAGVASRSIENAQSFVQKHSGARAYGAYEDLLADSGVDIIYVAGPHQIHAEWAIKAARAGKHVLCEKPIAVNHAQAMAIIDAAETAGVFVMEAFMYRCHPQTEKIVELVASGAVGQVRMIEASFGFNAPFDAQSRLYSNALAGGGILDVGCYPVSMSRLIAGAAQGATFANPIAVKGAGWVGETGVDHQAAAVLKFEGGLIARVSTSVSVTLGNDVTIYGEIGRLCIPSPWHPVAPGETSSRLLLETEDGRKDEITVDAGKNLFTIEADRVAQDIAAGRTQSDAMSWADTLGNMKALDAWRRQAGVSFEFEQAPAGRNTIAGKALHVAEKPPMPYRKLSGVAPPASRLVMGCDNQETLPHAEIMFDDFIERGGNCFDTAHIYGGGVMERLLGDWMIGRGVRKDLVVIGKGAHSPNCYPERIREELDQSLDRLQTEYVDVYLLHRDNPEAPVGEFIDALNVEINAGRVRAIGGSNWSQSRFAEANAYADKHGLRGLEIVSNNFSLARMEQPVWPGCVSASDDEFRQWLEQGDVSLMSWSSQARGFFTDRAGPEKHNDPELVNAWYSDGNFERRARAYQLAEQKGVEPVHIALAYVLAQPFEPFALIGPRTIAETKSSFQALEIALTVQECAWLDLRTPSSEAN
jgi:predicted dehydrogenase/aryl-alcohol dehydrogenase-like predicted oxidoreductase